MGLIDTPKTSRRAILAGAAGAAAASVAAAIGRPSTLAAANGDVVHVGNAHTGSSPTMITNSSGDGLVGRNQSAAASGVFGHSTSATGTTYGVFGRSDSSQGSGVGGYAAAASGVSIGVHGWSSSATDGRGVYGRATATTGNSYGVVGASWSSVGHGAAGFAEALTGLTRGVLGYAYSSSGTGVYGNAAASNGTTTGVFGRVNSPSGTGVIGYSGFGNDPATSPKTGVYGYAAQDSGSRGVFGYTTAGQGVRGQATSGTAGFFATPRPSTLYTGTALRAVGRVRFDQCAGVAAVAAGATSVTVSPAIDIVSTTAVVATAMGGTASSPFVRRVTTNATANTFTIHISGAAPAGGLKVAWHCFG